MSFFKKSSGILGMNARNLLYVQKYNTRAHQKFADDKIFTKTFLQSRNIGVAKLYHIIKSYKDFENFSFKDLPDKFVIKPNHGYGGDGILIISGKDEKEFSIISGDKMSMDEMYLHITSILDGKYSLSGSYDQVIIEEYLEVIDNLKKLMTVEGLPDIRIILFNYVPIIAMLRIPTKESEGKGNLQLGAIGLGIDIVSGKLTYGYKDGKFITRLINGDKIAGFNMPEWDSLLLTSSKIQQSTGVGFVGVDLALTDSGIKVLEINARPGLKIQVCNKVRMMERLELVKNYKVMNPEQGVKLAKQLFSEVVVTENKISSNRKPIIGLIEPITIYGDTVKTLLAKIDPYADENLIINNIKHDCLIDVSIQNKRIKLPFKKMDASKKYEYDAVISGKFLGDFLIDTTIRNKIDNSQIKDINEKMILNVDKKIYEIDKKLKYISYIKPLNLLEIKETFMKYKNFSPQFEYKELEKNFLEDLKKDIIKLPQDIDHELMPVYKEKMKELGLKIQLLKAINSNEFGDISEKIFGEIDYYLYKSAINAIKNINVIEDDSKIISLNDLKKRFKLYLKEKKLDRWEVRYVDGATANISVNKSGIIFINKDIHVSENHFESLIAHEIETHVYRAENARSQKYRIFERGFANYLETEEGLSMVNQRYFGLNIGEKALWAPLRVIGAYMGKKMSFVELFHYLKDTFGVEDETAFKTCLKVKRGLKDTGILTSFTKDIVYFTGEKKVINFLKKATPEEIKLLYSGKVSIESLKILKNIELQAPKFLSKYMLNLLEEKTINKEQIEK